MSKIKEITDNGLLDLGIKACSEMLQDVHKSNASVNAEEIERLKPILNLKVKNKRPAKEYWTSAWHKTVDVYLDGNKIGKYSWHPGVHGSKPDLYDVESCFVKDAECVADGISFEEFCREFGYDIWGENRNRYYQMYSACVDTYWVLKNTGKWEDLKNLHWND